MKWCKFKQMSMPQCLHLFRLQVFAFLDFFPTQIYRVFIAFVSCTVYIRFFQHHGQCRQNMPSWSFIKCIYCRATEKHLYNNTLPSYSTNCMFNVDLLRHHLILQNNNKAGSLAMQCSNNEHVSRFLAVCSQDRIQLIEHISFFGIF